MAGKVVKQFELVSGEVNFVCPRCQRVYYRADMDQFNDDRQTCVRDAKVYKKHYHSCKRKGGNHGS